MRRSITEKDVTDPAELRKRMEEVFENLYTLLAGQETLKAATKASRGMSLTRQERDLLDSLATGSTANPVPPQTSIVPSGDDLPPVSSATNGQLFRLNSDGIVRIFSETTSSWDAIGAAAAAHNVLSTTHSDTIAASVVLGDLLAGNGTPKWARLPGNTMAVKQYLAQTGAGAGVSAPPVWVTPVSTDLSDTATLARLNAANVYTQEQTIDMGNGSSVVYGFVSELVTLSTVALFTNTTANLPASSLIKGVLVYIQTGITGPPTVYRVGDPTTTDRFGSDDPNITVGNGRLCSNHLKGSVTTDAAGPTQAGIAKVRLTLDAIPTAGKVRVVWHYERYTPPTS